MSLHSKGNEKVMVALAILSDAGTQGIEAISLGKYFALVYWLETQGLAKEFHRDHELHYRITEGGALKLAQLRAKQPIASGVSGRARFRIRPFGEKG